MPAPSHHECPVTLSWPDPTCVGAGAIDLATPAPRIATLATNLVERVLGPAPSLLSGFFTPLRGVDPDQRSTKSNSVCRPIVRRRRGQSAAAGRAVPIAARGVCRGAEPGGGSDRMRSRPCLPPCSCGGGVGWAVVRREK
ncbi:hypothetical protein NL676_016780 [Syzygium grande]|nr:hypothetical protein NL676_016780 [Syzygium grande]